MTSGGGDYFNFRSTSSSRRVTPIPAYIYGPVMLTGGIMVYCYYSCLNEAPLTKRKRLIATSPEMERKMGDDQHRALLKQFHGSILPSDHRARSLCNVWGPECQLPRLSLPPSTKSPPPPRLRKLSFARIRQMPSYSPTIIYLC